MHEETSNTWLQSLKTGDPHASGWHYLLESYGPFVRKILIRKGLQPASADDVAQNVMTIVAKKLPDFERQRSGSFRTWLRGITVNCLRDYLKSQQYRSRAAGGSEMLELANAMEDSKSEFTMLWNQRHARHVLDELLKAVAPEFSPKTIAAFRHLAIDDQPVDDVAEQLEMSPNACFIARSRVLKRLKVVLREVFGEDDGLFDLMA